MKRVVCSEAGNRLAKALLDGTVADGSTVTIDTAGPADDPTSELTIR